MWDVLKEVSLEPIDEATILNMSTHKRMSLLEKAYRAAARRLKEMRENEQEDVGRCVAIATHACFHWKTGFLSAFPIRLLPSLTPNVFVTIMHCIKNVKENLDKDPSHRFSDIIGTDILYWRARESEETNTWANSLRKAHFVVARNQPVETLYKILFKEGTKRIYFSYPMSHVPKKERKAAAELINRLRDIGYIVFDPGSIDDTKYVDELLDADPCNPLHEHLGKDVDDHTVKLDYLLIRQSGLVVARYPAVKWSQGKNHEDRMYIPLSAGVICEMVYGHSEGKRVYAVWLPKSEPSPFFIYHCKEYFSSEEGLLDYLTNNEPP